MQLKRIFDRKTGKLDRIEVTRISENQKITQRTIDRLMADNAVTVGHGKIVLHTVPELTFKIDSMPGLYCCHDNKLLSDQKTARKYVADNFSDVESPDKQNPSGYRKQDFYQCTNVTGEK